MRIACGVLRAGFDGIWRLRVTGTTFSFGGNYSRGLDALGARMAADAITLLPLSRQGADAVFEERDGHTKVNQALPSDFSVSIAASGQTSLYFKRSGVFRQTLLGNIGAGVAAINKRI